MTNEPALKMNTSNILIVDDIAANLKVLGDILRCEGYKVRPVPSGKLALAAATKERPDLILLDIMMPDMDGIEVCALFKENPNLVEIPIIFISALSDTNDIVKALTAGGVDYITKPFQADEVKARVATHIKISQQKMELQAQRAELQKNNSDKDRFISILAHDLRNPFHALLGFSELLYSNIRKYDLDQIESFASNIYKSSKNTYNLLEDLLLWARAQSNKISFDPQTINITNIFKIINEILKPSADAKNITLSFVSLQNIDFHGDKNMIKTILRNLVSNAIKFTNTGGQIKIESQITEECVTITVADNGVGIKPEILPKLFNISKTHTTLGTASEMGTGLGLLICKEFVEKHKGQIWVESEVGKGSQFKFTIPL